MLTVSYIDRDDWLQAAFRIREKVFVEEQGVPAADEYDEFETTARHFLAHQAGTPCGTARWRQTDRGVKLERFAVLPEFRSRQVGSALVRALLADVRAWPGTAGRPVYLHAQTTAMPLYAKFGFQPVGELFLECGIAHYKMVLPA